MWPKIHESHRQNPFVLLKPFSAGLDAVGIWGRKEHSMFKAKQELSVGMGQRVGRQKEPEMGGSFIHSCIHQKHLEQLKCTNVLKTHQQ